MDTYYTPREAAEKFNLKEKTLKDWLRGGKVKGEKVGRSWRIADSELRRYLRLPIPLEKIDKRYIKAELEDLQQLLLEVDQGHREGMERSEALKLVSKLEETIQEIEGIKFSRLDRYNLNPISTGAKFNRMKPEIDIKEKITGTIKELIKNLILYGDDNLNLKESVQFLEDAIKNKSDTKLSPRGERDLKELIDLASEFQEKENQQTATMVDAYRLASFFRRVEENLILIPSN
jgi:excisionase family DNA binding protein